MIPELSCLFSQWILQYIKDFSVVFPCSDAKSDSFPRTGSFWANRLIEPVQKADSSVPEFIKQ